MIFRETRGSVLRIGKTRVAHIDVLTFRDQGWVRTPVKMVAMKLILTVSSQTLIRALRLGIFTQVDTRLQ